jgi:hypothetical protein
VRSTERVEDLLKQASGLIDAAERRLEGVNALGEAFLSHVVLGGRYALRLAIDNIRTQERHVQRACEILGPRPNAGAHLRG